MDQLSREAAPVRHCYSLPKEHNVIDADIVALSINPFKQLQEEYTDITQENFLEIMDKLATIILSNTFRERLSHIAVIACNQDQITQMVLLSQTLGEQKIQLIRDLNMAPTRHFTNYIILLDKISTTYKKAHGINPKISVLVKYLGGMARLINSFHEDKVTTPARIASHMDEVSPALARSGSVPSASRRTSGTPRTLWGHRN